MSVEAGQGVTITCNGGTLAIANGSADEDETVVAAGDVSEEIEFEVDLVSQASEVEEAAVGPLKAACVARSRTWDIIPEWLPGEPLRMTEMQLRLSWLWDGTRIRGLGRFRALVYFFGATGWRPKGYTSRYLYQRVYNSSGYWIQQGAEGWTTFRTDALWHPYEHTHQMIIYVSRTGSCRAENHFSGDLPDGGRQTFDVRKLAYEPRG